MRFTRRTLTAGLFASAVTAALAFGAGQAAAAPAPERLPNTCNIQQARECLWACEDRYGAGTYFSCQSYGGYADCSCYP